MKIPFWKVWWSYFTEVLLEHTGSEYNEDLYVILHKGRLQLCTDDAIYSYDDKYDNFKFAFEQIDLNRLPKQADVLVLGLGLASIPFILEKNFNKDYHYDCVEIDEEVAYLCAQYSTPRLRSSIQMYITDAAQYVPNCYNSYDMICIDIFQSSIIPEEFETAAFLLEIKELCKEDTMILVNRLGYTATDKQGTKDYYEQIFKKVFPNAVMRPIRGNYILMSEGSWIQGERS
jgi:spermidine synthase